MIPLTLTCADTAMISLVLILTIVVINASIIRADASITHTYITQDDGEYTTIVPWSSTSIFNKSDNMESDQNNKTIRMGVLVEDSLRTRAVTIDTVASAISIAVEDFAATGALNEYSFK